MQQQMPFCVYIFYQQFKIHFSSTCFSSPVVSEKMLIFFAVDQSKGLGKELRMKASKYQKLIQDNFPEVIT